MDIESPGQKPGDFSCFFALSKEIIKLTGVKNMKKYLLVLLAAFCAFGSLKGYAALPQPEVSADSAVLYEPLSKQVLFSKKAEIKRGIASTTKIMTAIVAIENLNLSAQVTIEAKHTMVEGSSMYLTEGEKLTVKELLYGLMLTSGNDAALAIADELGGIEECARLMNDKAQQLGLINTHFTNPHGLDDENHYSTALDMAKLAAYALENKIFAEICNCTKIQIGTRILVNHNRLLNELEGCEGVKTGFTKACGRCLVSAVCINGFRLIAVTLNAPNDWEDHEKMYAYAYDNYEQVILSEKWSFFARTPVLDNIFPQADIFCAETVKAVVPVGEKENITVSIILPRYDEFKAAGQAGYAKYYLGDKLIAQVRLIYIQRNREMQFI